MRNNVNVVSDVAADAWNGIAMSCKATVALLTPHPGPMKSEGRMSRGHIYRMSRAEKVATANVYRVGRR